MRVWEENTQLIVTALRCCMRVVQILTSALRHLQLSVDGAAFATNNTTVTIVTIVTIVHYRHYRMSSSPFSDNIFL